MQVRKGIIIAVDPLFFSYLIPERKGLGINTDMVNDLKAIRNLLDCKLVLYSCVSTDLLECITKELKEKLCFEFDAVNEDISEFKSQNPNKIYADLYLEENFFMDKEEFLQELVKHCTK